MLSYNMYINGKHVPAISKKYCPIINPATEKVIAHVPLGDERDVEKAVQAARKAFPSWKNTTPAERANYLLKLADLLEKDIKNFAKLESDNVGKTIKYARDSDMPFIIDNLRFFAGLARSAEGESAGEFASFIDKKKEKPLGTSQLRREPLGVIGAIIPWNYPLYIAMWKIAPALAAGNTLVIKPASLTPLTLIRFAMLCDKAGLPPGVINIVTGPGEKVGTAIASHPDIDMVAMTGDTSTGKKIMQLASENVKKVHLELGGKAPLIVLEDANLDAAARGAIAGAFWNTGQDCTAVTRVYIPNKHLKKFKDLCLREIKKIRIGDPSKEETDMGPLISAKQRERVENYIQLAKKQKAKILFGGKHPKLSKEMEKGYFLEPTILTGVKHHSKICQEEIFGPVLMLFPYNKKEEAIKLANDVIYGLAASVWGKDITQCMKVAQQLDFGTVWINEHGVLLSEMPHGGFKQSGFGKDLSIHSFHDYTRLKHIYIDETGLARKPWHGIVYGKE